MEHTDDLDGQVDRLYKKLGDLNFEDEQVYYLEDLRLSYKAMGMMAYLLHHINAGNRMRIPYCFLRSSNACISGKNLVYSGLDELKRYGYLRIEYTHHKEGPLVNRLKYKRFVISKYSNEK